MGRGSRRLPAVSHPGGKAVRRKRGSLEEGIAREALFGSLPILANERLYGFLDGLLLLSGYCIATWSYTQGAYLASLVGFRQLLIGAFFGALLMLCLYQLPVILSVRYGIDIWIWLRAVFGGRGIQVMTAVIIVVNYPWYAVCADLFASSMERLASLLGLPLPGGAHGPLGLVCILLGTLLALRGPRAMTAVTRALVPLLLAVGVLVLIVGFRAVPFSAIWDYRPAREEENALAYLISIEANFAFVITLVGGMAGIPRLMRSERAGFWAGVLGQGLSGSFFVVIGAVIAIATQTVTGRMTEDPTLMLAVLAAPAMALCSLLLVAFANIGTQAVGAYLYGVMLKSAFRTARYRRILFLLTVYACGLTLWGGVVEYFGSFLTLSACIYAPLAALLFSDFFFVRRQRLSLRSAFGLPGYGAYRYSGGFNLVGLCCAAAGAALSLAVYDPVSGTVHCPALFFLTPTGLSFLGTAALYRLLSLIPLIRRYLLRDRDEITV